MSPGGPSTPSQVFARTVYLYKVAPSGLLAPNNLQQVRRVTMSQYGIVRLMERNSLLCLWWGLFAGFGGLHKENRPHTRARRGTLQTRTALSKYCERLIQHRRRLQVHCTHRPLYGGDRRSGLRRGPRSHRTDDRRLKMQSTKCAK